MKKNEIFEAILTASCDVNEQPKAVVLSRFRNIELVDTRVMAVVLMKRYGMSDVFIASMFGRTRQWVSFARNLFNIRYATCSVSIANCPNAFAENATILNTTNAFFNVFIIVLF